MTVGSPPVSTTTQQSSEAGAESNLTTRPKRKAKKSKKSKSRLGANFVCADASAPAEEGSSVTTTGCICPPGADSSTTKVKESVRGGSGAGVVTIARRPQPSSSEPSDKTTSAYDRASDPPNVTCNGEATADSCSSGIPSSSSEQPAVVGNKKNRSSWNQLDSLSPKDLPSAPGVYYCCGTATNVKIRVLAIRDTVIDFLHVTVESYSAKDTEMKGRRLQVSDSALCTNAAPDVVRAAAKSCIDRLQMTAKDASKIENIDDGTHDFLLSQSISFLAVPSLRFTQAKYLCHLCDHHLNSISHAIDHVKEADHCRNKMSLVLKQLLTLIAPPIDEVKVAIGELLIATSAENTPSEDEQRDVESAVEVLTTLVKEKIDSRCSVRLYGSWPTEMNIATSNVNLELVYPQDINHAYALGKASEIVHESPKFNRLMSSFGGRCPSIHFELRFKDEKPPKSKDRSTVPSDDEAKPEPRRFVMSCRNRIAYNTSQVLGYYVRLFPVLKILGKCLRNWARLCCHDDVAAGGMCPYVFDLMLIFYLQRTSQLPVLFLDEKEAFSQDEDFELTPSRMQKAKEIACTYHLYDARDIPPLALGDLWLGLFRFFSCGPFVMHTDVISVRRATVATRDELGWNRKRMGVEDPFMTKNVVNLLTEKFAYLRYTIDYTYVYFALPEDVSRASSPDDALQTPVVNCTACQSIEHREANCPEMVLPTPRPLKPSDPFYLNDLLSPFLRDLYALYRATEERQEQWIHFVGQLQSHLHNSGFPSAMLHLFGSCANGFGGNGSDLDLCLTFTDAENLDEEEQVRTIKKLAKLMYRTPYVTDVMPVTRAKVPIVKFSYPRLRIECDISLYNTLALRNTGLVRSYAQIDVRFGILGYVVKQFAKACDIGDASKGTLSSYAYIVLLIHYLQRTSPPVLPCLQELQTISRPKRQVMVDGWDTYYWEDLGRLRDAWTHYGRNKESVGQLWIGFLNYYVEKFPFCEEVVTVKQLAPLSKFEKLWNDKWICIEDPFDLKHNLGTGISRRMFVHIMHAFNRAREVFGDPVSPQQLQFIFRKPMVHYEDLENYFFKRLRLDRAAPRDRVCHACGHVGHFVEQCPRRRRDRRGNDSAILDFTDDEGDEQQNRNGENKRSNPFHRSKSECEPEPTYGKPPDPAMLQIGRGRPVVGRRPHISGNRGGGNSVRHSQAVPNGHPQPAAKPVSILQRLTQQMDSVHLQTHAGHRGALPHHQHPQSGRQQHSLPGSYPPRSAHPAAHHQAQSAYGAPPVPAQLYATGHGTGRASGHDQDFGHLRHGQGYHHPMEFVANHSNLGGHAPPRQSRFQ